MQFHLGHLPRINRPALLAWELDRFLVLAAHHQPDAGLDQLLTDLQESVALQWLHSGLDGTPVHLHFFEAEPSPRYSQLKRVLAHSADGDATHSVGAHLTHHTQAAQCLHDLTQLAHQRFARLATTQAADWSSYNAQGSTAGKRPEAWHCVLFTDIYALAEHHNGSLHHLKTLCTQGPRAGIVPLLLKKPVPDWLHQNNVPLFVRQLQAFWDEVLPQAWGLAWSTNTAQATPQPLNQHPELWRLLTKFGLTLQAQGQHEQAQQLIDALTQQTEQSSARDFVNVRIGQSTETGKPVAFRMGEAADCYHAFVAGTTRSGKSTLLNNLILSLCESYSPQQLQLSLLDFKSNVGFGIYRGLAHVASLIDSQDPATVEQALAQFADEIDRRGRLFAAQTKLVNGTLDKYNALAEADGFAPLPRWIMVIDEAQVLFENRALKGLAKYMLSRISRMGAGLGLHLIICTQSFQNVEFEGDVKAQFRLRLGLKLANSQDCRALMGHDNDAPMYLRMKDGFPRQALLNTEDGLPRGNLLLDLDFVSDEVLIQRLDALKKAFPAEIAMKDQSMSGDEALGELVADPCGRLPDANFDAWNAKLS